jgi:hypothetical protein
MRLSFSTIVLAFVSLFLLLCPQVSSQTSIFKANKRAEYYMHQTRKERFVDNSTFIIKGETIRHISDEDPHTYTIVGYPEDVNFDGIVGTQTPCKSEDGNPYYFIMDTEHHRIIIEDFNFLMREYNIVSYRTKK